jgi:hypothetical protein
VRDRVSAGRVSWLERKSYALQFLPKYSLSPLSFCLILVVLNIHYITWPSGLAVLFRVLSSELTVKTLWATFNAVAHTGWLNRF